MLRYQFRTSRCPRPVLEARFRWFRFLFIRGQSAQYWSSRRRNTLMNLSHTFRSNPVRFSQLATSSTPQFLGSSLDDAVTCSCIGLAVGVGLAGWADTFPRWRGHEAAESEGYWYWSNSPPGLQSGEGFGSSGWSNWVWKYNHEQTKVTRPNKHVADPNSVLFQVLLHSQKIFYNLARTNILL